MAKFFLEKEYIFQVRFEQRKNWRVKLLGFENDIVNLKTRINFVQIGLVTALYTR